MRKRTLPIENGRDLNEYRAVLGSCICHNTKTFLNYTGCGNRHMGFLLSHSHGASSPHSEQAHPNSFFISKIKFHCNKYYFYTIRPELSHYRHSEQKQPQIQCLQKFCLFLEVTWKKTALLFLYYKRENIGGKNLLPRTHQQTCSR